MQSEVTPASIRLSAMNMLAMREHSAAELMIKLAQKYSQQAWIHDVILGLQSDGLQSDSRFAHAFVNMRRRQGKGPLLISRELKERGLSSELISENLASTDESWNELAAAVRVKKFGLELPGDTREKARQMRFLAARGFSSTSVHYAMRAYES